MVIRSSFLAAALGFAPLACAFDFDDVLLWTGSGPNRAILVIDFNDGTSPQSFAWGYRWSGESTSEQMVRSIDSGDPRLATVVLGQGGVGFGAFLDSATYDADGDAFAEHTGPTWPAGWWQFWNKDASGQSWAEATGGMSTRTLTDGAWDGWSFVRDNVQQAPGMPVAAVPEPATLIALAAGIAMLGRRRS